MKKLLSLFVLLFICGYSYSQIYAPVTPTTYGRHENRLKSDSAQHVPEKTALSKNTTDTSAQVFYFKADSSFYGWSKAKGYQKLSGSGGGGGGGGLVQSVTGFNIDNTDPSNPIVLSTSTDLSILGDGTLGNPFRVDSAKLWRTNGNAGSGNTFGTTDDNKVNLVINNTPYGYFGNGTWFTSSLGIGYNVLDGNTGTGNYAFGHKALGAGALSGSSNVAIGGATLFSNTTGSSNIAIGTALGNNISGSSNIAIGGGGVLLNNNADRNIAIGQNSMSTITTGSRNIGIGYASRATSATNRYSIAIGDSASASSNQFALSDSIKRLKMKGLGKGVVGYVLKDTTGNGDLALQAESGGGGSGTVTTVSRTNGYGISASVSNPSTTPDITIAIDSNIVYNRVRVIIDSLNREDTIRTVRATGIYVDTTLGLVYLKLDTSIITTKRYVDSLFSSGLSGWSLSGNSGTNPSTNFIGTTDSVDLVFKTNNIESGRIDVDSGNVSLGRYAIPISGNKLVNIGLSAGQGAIGLDKVSIGAVAGFENIGNYAVYIGGNTRNTIGNGITSVGHGSGNGSIGDWNTLIGVSSGVSNYSNYSTIIGGNSGDFNYGDSCTFVGALSGYSNSGIRSTFIGMRAGGLSNPYRDAIAIGYNSIPNADKQLSISDSITAIKAKGITGASNSGYVLTSNGAGIFTAQPPAGPGSWTDYSATSTITGWSSYTTKLMQYEISGKTMSVMVQLEGTGSGTTTSFTLPNNATAWGTQYFILQTQNNTTQSASVATVSANGNTVTISNSASTTPSWTNAVQRNVRGQFFINIQ